MARSECSGDRRGDSRIERIEQDKKHARIGPTMQRYGGG